MAEPFNLSAEITLQLAQGSAASLKKQIADGFKTPIQFTGTEEEIKKAKRKVANKPVEVPITFKVADASDNYAAIKKKIGKIPVDVEFDKKSVRENIAQTKLNAILKGRTFKVKVEAQFDKASAGKLADLEKFIQRATLKADKLKAALGDVDDVKINTSQLEILGNEAQEASDDITKLIIKLQELTTTGSTQFKGGKFFKEARSQISSLLIEMEKIGGSNALLLLEKKFEGLNGKSADNLINSLRTVFKAFTDLDSQKKKLDQAQIASPKRDFSKEYQGIEDARKIINKFLLELDSADPQTFGNLVASTMREVGDATRRTLIASTRDIERFSALLSNLNQKKAGIVAGSGRAQTQSRVDDLIAEVNKQRAAGANTEQIKASATFQQLNALLGELKYVDVAARRAQSSIENLLYKTKTSELRKSIGGRSVGLDSKVNAIGVATKAKVAGEVDPKKMEQFRAEGAQDIANLNQRAEKLNGVFGRIFNQVAKFKADGFDEAAKSLQKFAGEVVKLDKLGVSIENIDRAVTSTLARSLSSKGLDGKVNTSINAINRLKNALNFSPVDDLAGAKPALDNLEANLKARTGKFSGLTQEGLNNELSKGLFDIRGMQRFNEAADTTVRKMHNISDGFEDMSKVDVYKKYIADFESGSKKIAASADSVGEKLQKLRNLSDKTLTNAKLESEGGFFGSLARSAGLATKRLAAFLVMAQGLYTIQGALSSSFTEAIKVDKEFTKLEQVLNKDFSGAVLTANLKSLTSQVKELGRSFGVATLEVAQSAQVLAQAGIKGKDLETLLDVVTKSQLGPSFGTAADTAEASIAIMKQFNLTAEGTARALGGINVLSAKYAVEAKGITEAVRRAGGVFSSAGDDVASFAAAFTIIKQKTREADESIATGLRNISQRLQTAETQNKLRDILGIDLAENGEFIGFEASIKRIGGALEGVSQKATKFAQVRKIIGGTLQGGKANPLLQDYVKFDELVAEFRKGADSINEDVQVAFQSIENKLARAKAAVTDLFHEIITSDFVKFLVDGFTVATLFATRLLKTLNSVPGAILAIAAASKLLGNGKIVTQAFLSNFQRRGPVPLNKGGATPFNEGGSGLIPGAGPNKDSILAYLTTGEYVLQRKAVKKYGHTFLDNLNNGAIEANKGGAIRRNRGGIIPGFVSGGPVKFENELDLADRVFAAGIKKFVELFKSVLKITLPPESSTQRTIDLPNIADDGPRFQPPPVPTLEQIKSSIKSSLPKELNAKLTDTFAAPPKIQGVGVSVLDQTLKSLGVEIKDFGNYVNTFTIESPDRFRASNVLGGFKNDDKQLRLNQNLQNLPEDKQNFVKLHEVGHSIQNKSGIKTEDVTIPQSVKVFTRERLKNSKNLTPEKLNKEFFADAFAFLSVRKSQPIEQQKRGPGSRDFGDFEKFRKQLADAGVDIKFASEEILKAKQVELKNTKGTRSGESKPIVPIDQPPLTPKDYYQQKSRLNKGVGLDTGSRPSGNRKYGPFLPPPISAEPPSGGIGGGNGLPDKYTTGKLSFLKPVDDFFKNLFKVTEDSAQANLSNPVQVKQPTIPKVKYNTANDPDISQLTTPDNVYGPPKPQQQEDPDDLLKRLGLKAKSKAPAAPATGFRAFLKPSGAGGAPNFRAAKSFIGSKIFGGGGGGGGNPPNGPKNPSGGGGGGGGNPPNGPKGPKGTVGGLTSSIPKGGLIEFGKGLLTTKGGLIGVATSLFAFQSTIGGLDGAFAELIITMGTAAASMYSLSKIGSLTGLGRNIGDVALKGGKSKQYLTKAKSIGAEFKGSAEVVAKQEAFRNSPPQFTRTDPFSAEGFKASNRKKLLEQAKSSGDRGDLFKNIRSAGGAPRPKLSVPKVGGLGYPGSLITKIPKSPKALANIASLGGKELAGSLGTFAKAGKFLAGKFTYGAIAAGLLTGALDFFVGSLEEAAIAGKKNATTVEEAKLAGSKGRAAKALKTPVKALGNTIGGAITGASIGAMAAPFLGPLAPLGPLIGAIAGGLIGFLSTFKDKLFKAITDAVPWIGELATGIKDGALAAYEATLDGFYVISETIQGRDGAKSLQREKKKDVLDFNVNKIKKNVETGYGAKQSVLGPDERLSLLTKGQIASGTLKGLKKNLGKGDPNVSFDTLERGLKGKDLEAAQEGKAQVTAELQDVADVYKSASPKNRQLILDSFKANGEDFLELTKEVGIVVDEAKSDMTAAFDKLSLFFVEMKNVSELSSARLSGLEGGLEVFSDPSKKSDTLPSQYFDILKQGIDPATLGLGDTFKAGEDRVGALAKSFDPRLAKNAEFEIKGRRAARNASTAVIKAAPEIKSTKDSDITSFLKGSFQAATGEGADSKLNEQFATFLASKGEDASAASLVDKSGEINTNKVNDLFKEFADSLENGSLEQMQRLAQLSEQYVGQYKAHLAARFALENEQIGLLQDNVGKRKAIGDIQNKAKGLTGDKLAAAQGKQAKRADFENRALQLQGTGLGGGSSIAQISASLLASQQRGRNAATDARKQLGPGATQADVDTRRAEIEGTEEEAQNRLKAALTGAAAGGDTMTHAMQEFERASAKAASSSKFLSDALLGSDDQMAQTVLGIQAMAKVSAAFKVGGVAAAQQASATLGEEGRQALGAYAGQNEDTQAELNRMRGISSDISGGKEAQGVEEQMRLQMEANNGLVTALKDNQDNMKNNTDGLRAMYETQFKNASQIVAQAEATTKGLVDKIAALPEVIKHDVNINVNIVGAANLGALEKTMKQFAEEMVAARLDALLENNLGLNRP